MSLLDNQEINPYRDTAVLYLYLLTTIEAKLVHFFSLFFFFTTFVQGRELNSLARQVGERDRDRQREGEREGAGRKRDRGRGETVGEKTHRIDSICPTQKR